MSDTLQPQVVVDSRLAAGNNQVWRWISSLRWVNAEMEPWLRLVAPNGVDLESGATGAVLPLKLSGPLGLPLGTYRLCLVSFTGGVGFLEQTRILPFFLWQHERTIVPLTEGGTSVTDSLGWKWRGRLLDPLVAAGVRSFFQHRHRRLRLRPVRSDPGDGNG